MRAPNPFRPSLAALLTASLALPAAAQQAPARTTGPAPVTFDEPVRRVAAYRFLRRAHDLLPAEVNVADSAGTLVARFRLAEGAAELPMMIDAIGEDLVLQGDTPRGLLTLRFFSPAAARNEYVGRWWVDGREGELRARVIR